MEKKIAILIAMFFVVFSACKKDENDDTVSYKDDVKAIFTSNCQACHIPTGAASTTGLFYDTYENTAAAAATETNGQNRTLAAIKHTAGFVAMPESAPKLSDANISTIEKWISAGRPNN